MMTRCCPLTNDNIIHKPHHFTNHPIVSPYSTNAQQNTDTYIKDPPQQDVNVTIQLLEDTLSIIQYGEKKIFLLGTHHMSMACAQQVREVIEEVQPQTIVLEICKERAKYLLVEAKKYKNKAKEGEKITRFDRKQLLIGGEFRTALMEGQKIDAKLVYADIDQRILAERFKFGLKTCLENPDLTLNDRLKLRFGTITWRDYFGMMWNGEKTIDRLRNRKSMKERLDFMTLKAPYLQNGIMDERNDIMASAIRDCEGNLVVAVVGMDHMEGIEDRFKTKFAGVDLNKYKQTAEQMLKEKSMERLGKLAERDVWIGNEYAEFKHSRDLPQKF